MSHFIIGDSGHRIPNRCLPFVATNVVPSHQIVTFEWDEPKAALNLRKHGVSFLAATQVFRDANRSERLEDSEDYGETRWIVIGLAGDFVVTVVYALRTDNIRIISARRATRNEVEIYWNR
jgi:uncharacterized protein